MDISNAFLNNQCAEKKCFKEGPEFKSREGLLVIIVRSLYDLKISGASFRAHLANTLHTMGFKPTFAYPNVCICKNFLTLPQEINDSAGSGTNTDTSALRLAPNTSNSAPTSGTP